MHDGIQIAGGRTVRTVVGTIADPGVPLILMSDLDFGDASDITIAPGTQFLSARGYPYEVTMGWNGSGRVTAIGTADAPIVFRSEAMQAGAWKGVTVNSSATTDTRIDHVEVSDASLTLARPIMVTNSKFTNSPGYDIVKSSSDRTDYTRTNTFMGNTLGNVK